MTILPVQINKERRDNAWENKVLLGSMFLMSWITVPAERNNPTRYDCVLWNHNLSCFCFRL